MDALVILVGVTANPMKRGAVRNYFQRQSAFDVFVPNLPQWMGLSLCSRWLVRYLVSKFTAREYHYVHFLNYISGGFIFRSINGRCDFLRLGRVVYNRAPIQELVPRQLIRKYSEIGLVLSRGKMLTDLARGSLKDLPFPSSLKEQGLIIETEASLLARSLGLSRASVPLDAWNYTHLLPGASDVLEVSLSHDDVYQSEQFLSQALHFLNYGKFMAQAEIVTMGNKCADQ
jgi:hypothetical protein